MIRARGLEGSRQLLPVSASGTGVAAFQVLSGLKLSIFGASVSVRGPRSFWKTVAVLVDDEGHHAGIAVVGRVGDEAEAADHLAAHDVVIGATGSRRSLARQDLVAVAVIGRPGAGRVALARGIGHEFADRALLLARLARPIEAVLLVRAADDLLGVGMQRRSCRDRRRRIPSARRHRRAPPRWHRPRSARHGGRGFPGGRRAC